MEHKIINTGDYLLIVDDSEIKEGDWVADFRLDGRILVSKWNEEDYEDGFFFDAKKVISHLPPNNSPILEGVILLPPLEDEVEKIAKQEAEKLHHKGKHDDWDIYNQLVYEDTEMIKKGYNKAKEKYKYTEEDIDKAYWAGMKFVGEDKGSYKEFIQSLQQPKYPVGFESEMVCRNLGCMKMILNGGNSVCCGDNMEPKTTTNSQGIIQWVGEYIY
jgi:hypothetical protein